MHFTLTESQFEILLMIKTKGYISFRLLQNKQAMLTALM